MDETYKKYSISSKESNCALYISYQVVIKERKKLECLLKGTEITSKILEQYITSCQKVLN